MRGFALSVVALLAACASGERAPVSYGSGGGAPPQHVEPPPPRAERSAPPARAPTQTISPSVQPNWAAGPGTPLSAWALQPSATFDPLNPPRTHTVAPHESLADIAALYQIPVMTLVDYNRLPQPYRPAPGTVLRLPPPRVHVVREGESLADIAAANEIDLHSLSLINRMQPPYSVRPGDRVVLPNVPGVAAEEAPPPRIEPPAATPAPVAGSGRFAWPLRGPIVARYGAQPNGVRLDGVEIGGREGDAIVAAADGDVIYSGSDVAGYGTLVLVRHGDNYVTAYGFARRALAHEGERVRAGQQIAELGPRPSGGARLLFQVRQGSHPVDPLPLLQGPG